MYVENHMMINPFCIDQDTSLSTVLAIMDGRGYRRIPVVEGKKLVGLVTETTISDQIPVRAVDLSKNELNFLFLKKKVCNVMVKDVITIHPRATLDEAAMLMRRHNIGCLVVIEKDGEVVGLISQNDIFEALAELMGYHQSGSRFVIHVEDDKVGVIADLSSAISSLGGFITNLSVYHKDSFTDVILRTSNINENDVVNIVRDLGHHLIVE